MTDYTPLLNRSLAHASQIKEIRRLASEAARLASSAELQLLPRNMPAKLEAAIEAAEQALAILREMGECE